MAGQRTANVEDLGMAAVETGTACVDGGRQWLNTSKEKRLSSGLKKPTASHAKKRREIITIVGAALVSTMT
jgi:hypothetical protein